MYTPTHEDARKAKAAIEAYMLTWKPVVECENGYSFPSPYHGRKVESLEYLCVQSHDYPDAQVWCASFQNEPNRPSVDALVLQVLPSGAAHHLRRYPFARQEMRIQAERPDVKQDPAIAAEQERAANVADELAREFPLD